MEVRAGQRVTEVDDASVVIGGERIPCRTVIWTAGVTPSLAGKWLNAPTDFVSPVCWESVARLCPVDLVVFDPSA